MRPAELHAARLLRYGRYTHEEIVRMTGVSIQTVRRMAASESPEGPAMVGEPAASAKRKRAKRPIRVPKRCPGCGFLVMTLPCMACEIRRRIAAGTVPKTDQHADPCVRPGEVAPSST